MVDAIEAALNDEQFWSQMELEHPEVLAAVFFGELEQQRQARTSDADHREDDEEDINMEDDLSSGMGASESGDDAGQSDIETHSVESDEMHEARPREHETSTPELRYVEAFTTREMKQEEIDRHGMPLGFNESDDLEDMYL